MSKQVLLRPDAGSYRVNDRVVGSKVMIAFVVLDFCNPRASARVPPYTLPARLVVPKHGDIFGVLLIGDDSQIVNAVVGLDLVDVVDLAARPFAINVQPSQAVLHDPHVVNAQLTVTLCRQSATDDAIVS